MKTERYELRMSEKEKEIIRNKAKNAKKNMSRYMIDCAINGKTVDYSHLSKLVVAVNKIGNNINQAVRVMQTYYGFDESDFDYFKNEFETLKRLLYEHLDG